jgi:type II secretory pathway pseudopilin PulG
MKSKRAITLIELTMSIVVISICLLSVGLIYHSVLTKNISIQSMTIATSLAEEKMDEVLRLGFSGISNDGPTAFADPFTDYTYQVTVINVQPTDLDTSTGATETGYKNVAVNVTYSLTGSIYELNSVLTDY